MPSRQQNKDKDVHQNDWAKLRKTLQKMQITMHSSIQQFHESLQRSLREVMTTIGQQQHRNESVFKTTRMLWIKNMFDPLQIHNNRLRNWNRGCHLPTLRKRIQIRLTRIYRQYSWKRIDRLDNHT